MMAQLFYRFRRTAPGLMTSQLYNEQTFYRAFEHDLVCCGGQQYLPYHRGLCCGTDVLRKNAF